MIHFLPLTNTLEWSWFHERTHAIRCEDTQGIVAYDADGIAAMAVFDTWTPDACSVHMAIDRPVVLRNGFLGEIARYLFIECHRDRIFGVVPSNNAKARRLNAHIGFSEVATIPDGIEKGVDVIVVRMDKADCRWLPVALMEVA